MRHSSITLTMDAYGHLFPGQDADAVAKMPSLLPSSEPQTLRATGTENAVPIWEQLGGKTCQDVASRGDAIEDELSGEGEDQSDANLLPLQDLASPGGVLASRGEERRARESNPQPASRHLISNQTANHSLTLRGVLPYGNDRRYNVTSSVHQLRFRSWQLSITSVTRRREPWSGRGR